MIIQGHPDPGDGHLGHALAEAYAQAAREAGHEATTIEVAGRAFPWLRTKEEYEKGPLPEMLHPAQQAIRAADLLCTVYPLWLGTLPAVLKAFLEQVFRPGFAFIPSERAWRRPLKGKSAHIVVTMMGMPVLLYRWYLDAHGVKSLERSVLGFCGIGPVRESLFSLVDAPTPKRRTRWLARMRRFGAAAR